ncbi:MAG: hypothetical protein CMJ35_10330 [Phycisphaerae bacterium]|nr:hypothetical protein [Phycisphaerae bacterium]MBM91993.1 hypothetical protein [Phycisphaerae bacterium]
MFRFTPVLATAVFAGVALAQHSPDATRAYQVQSGLMTENSGSFNYQGRLEVDGQPANGMYSFRFEAFEEPTGSNSAHELYFESIPVTVVDGLFQVDVQMGGTASEARRFWREVGNQELYFEISVGEFEGGPYTTLGTRTKLSWSARAQYAGIAESLRFPYSETYINEFGDPETMLSLTSAFGGTVAEFRSNTVTNEPTVYIRGERVFGSSFGFQSGALLVDSRDDEVGIRGEGSRFSVVGFFGEESTLSGVSAALLGNVGFGSSPDVVAVWAYNGPAETSALLGTENYAGDFSGDVIVDGNLRVEGEPVRDFGSNELSPIGPIAYGFVGTSGGVLGGTANLHSSWDNANSRYIISVDGENLSLGPYTVIATVVDSAEPRVATTNTAGGDLVVRIWDINSGNIAVQDNFQLVIYKPDPNAFVIRGAPDGFDADKYYEQTGASPIIGTTSTPAPAPTQNQPPMGLSD